VILKNYHSASSEEVRDRTVEPIHFSDNYTTVIALETETQLCKQFKLDRIGEVTETHRPFQYSHLHEHKVSDIFGLADAPTTSITLHLSARAYLLLREEHPLALPYLTHKRNRYKFHGPAHYAGIGRFVLGLIDEIEIIGPADFKEYICKKMNKMRN